MSDIKRFYAGKNVLVTGGTGFIGKVLVEKLLRDCDEVKCVYLIIRSGKLGFEHRCKDYTNHLVFDNLRKNNPKQLEKVHLVNGDLAQDDAGLSKSQLQIIIENVHIVLHAGASVRFDMRMWDALQSNTLGTYRLLELAKRIQQLEVFVYVSTTYSQSYVNVTEERHYAAQIDTFSLVRACNRFDQSTMDALQSKILDAFPNTYSFSKHLAEDLVYQYRNDFPICVVRPSVVMAAIKDPLPNYCEGLNGFFGFGVGVGRGVLRSFYMESDGYAFYVPVDMAANAVITTSWMHGSKKKDEIEYYNATVLLSNSTTFKKLCELMKKYRYETAFDYAVWIPNGSFTNCIYYHYLRVVLFQIIPAIFIDILLRLFRQRPIMMLVQRKIYSISSTITPYCRAEFRFNTDRFIGIQDIQNKVDRSIFDTCTQKLNEKWLVTGGGRGVRTFICKETDENYPRAVTVNKIMYWMHVAVQTVMLYFVAKFIWNRYFSEFLL